MNNGHSYSKLIILGIVFSLLLISSISNIGFSSSTITLDEGDGFWEIDVFEEGINIELTNCDTVDGNIVLASAEGIGHHYDYSTWSPGSESKAYYYKASYFMSFLPPSLHAYMEQRFDEEFDYPKIGAKDGNVFPHRGAEMEDSSFPLKRIHHFRFKLDQEMADYVSGMDVSWCGYGRNDKEISMYWWQPFIEEFNLGTWTRADTYKKSNGTSIELNRIVTEDDLFVSTDNFIDICIVMNPEIGKKCNLFSDYVNVTVYSKGYFPDGTAKSPLISPQDISTWETFSWADHEKSKTTITYHVLYQKNGQDILVEDEYLEGNENGFTDNSPIFLNQIPLDYKLKINATLETENQSISPEICRLSVTWQTKENTWQDLFNSTSNLRIDGDKIYNVSIANGNASIIPFYNDWAMFGQNPANTRSSDGHGPDSSNLYWYSFEGSGCGYRNPVIKNGVLYIASSNGEKIYSFDADFHGGASSENRYDHRGIGSIPDNSVNNSFAVTDKLVIVATSDEEVKNKVYAFDKNDLSTSPTWTYTDSDNSNIRYCSSPVIYDRNIFLSSCGENNKIIALDFNGNLQWDEELPANSLSSPAVYNGVIIVGCENAKDDSLVAFDIDGDELWKVNIGPVGRASPVIYDNKIFVMVKESANIPLTDYAFTKLVALHLDNGTELWNFSITSSQKGNIPNKGEFAACSTPTIHGDLIFVASPDNKLYVLNIEDGSKTEQWSSNPRNLYTTIIPPQKPLISSPVYADGMIYVGSQDGYVYAIDESNGDEVWRKDTYGNSPISSSPIVVDGLIYYGDEDGYLYCRGEPQGTEGQQIKGSIISIPISLPYPQENYTWDKFGANYSEPGGSIVFSLLDETEKLLRYDIDDKYDIYDYAKNHDTIKLFAEFTGNITNQAYLYNWSVTFRENGILNGTEFFEASFESEGTPPTICRIDVRNNDNGIWNNSAEYSLKYENQSVTETTDWISAQCSGENHSKSIETITANISELNLSENISLLSIRFSIKDSAENRSYSQWYEFQPPTDKDYEKPIFYESSFMPPDGWISSNTPTCSIEVQDKGTGSNTTGLNVDSAEYTLEYKIKDQSSTKTITDSLQCNGSNGSKNKETLSIDISKLDFSENITELIRISFYIEDLAKNPNSNYSEWHEFDIDTEKPFSYINNVGDIQYNNTVPVEITATAEDNVSGVDHVALLYRTLTGGNWTFFESDDSPPYSWSFSVASGEYELCTIATDKAGNDEDYPTEGDVSFIFDPNPPDAPSFDSEYRFDELPEFSIEFTDDYKLKSVEYRLHFNEADEWTKINDGDINSKIYAGNWNLTQDDWGYMIEEESYYMFFRLTDSLENQYITPSADEAMNIIKDFDINRSTPYDPDLSDFEEWHWDNVFTVSVNITDEDITNLQLHYSYSADNITWNEWKQYGDNQTSSPFIWNFTAEAGSGYYRFKTVAWGTSGNATTSDVKSVSVTLFPTIPIIIMVPLAVILILVTAFALGFKPFKLKKKKM